MSRCLVYVYTSQIINLQAIINTKINPFMVFIVLSCIEIMKVILASSSKFRKQLLEKLNISFKCISPDIDETRLNNEPVRDYVKRLSIEKASKIACSNHKSIVIGSDEVADLEGKIIGKPITKKNNSIVDRFERKSSILI